MKQTKQLLKEAGLDGKKKHFSATGNMIAFDGKIHCPISRAEIGDYYPSKDIEQALNNLKNKEYLI